MTKITDCLKDNASFTTMLTTLGFNVAERNRFSTDGFTAMEILSL